MLTPALHYDVDIALNDRIEALVGTLGPASRLLNRHEHASANMDLRLVTTIGARLAFPFKSLRGSPGQFRKHRPVLVILHQHRKTGNGVKSEPPRESGLWI